MVDLNNISHVYFVGIGGIGMSALARYLHQQGKVVAGYDKVATTLTIQLEKEGIAIHYDDNYDAIPAAFKNPASAQVIYTPAIPVGMSELTRFRESGINTIKRAQLLGQISRTMTCLAVAGTHGKTTTSAILAHLLYQSDVAVTAFCGGILEGYKTNYLCSGTDVMVVEADEFDRSFMQLQPDIAGITAMDPDHLDIYGDVATFEKTFHDFAALVPSGGLIINEKLVLNGITVGLNDAAYQAVDLSIVDGAYHFSIQTPQQLITNCVLPLPGQHNLANAILAMAMAIEYGAPVEKLKAALATFPGVERRFTYRINTSQRLLIDDYAHHPTEIDAVFHAVSEMYPGENVTAVFQPHLFSRTRDFMDGFASSLAQFNAVGLLDIYPARELPMDGITSTVLLEKIQMIKGDSGICELVQKHDLESFINRVNTRVVVMIGAGDIGVEIDRLTKIWSHEKI